MNRKNANMFKVIAMGRVGTLALNRFIDEHPNVSLPSFTDTASLLLKKWQPVKGLSDIPFDKSSKIERTGVMIHDADFFQKKNKRQLATLKNHPANQLIHLVRNPYQQAISWINYINAYGIMQIKGWQQIEPTVSAFYKLYKKHLDTLKIGKQCQEFYSPNVEVKVIDFQEILPEKADDTMAKVFEFLGVDSSFKSTLTQTIQNSYTRELMAKGIAFELNGEVIEMGMTPLNKFNALKPNEKPWIVIHDTDQIFDLCPSVPRIEGDWAFIPKNVQAFNKLSLQTRKMLSDDIRNIINEIIPVWAQHAERIAQQIEQSKITALSEKDKHFLDEYLKADLSIFFHHHPQFKAQWGM